MAVLQRYQHRSHRRPPSIHSPDNRTGSLIIVSWRGLFAIYPEGSGFAAGGILAIPEERLIADQTVVHGQERAREKLISLSTWSGFAVVSCGCHDRRWTDLYFVLYCHGRLAVTAAATMIAAIAMVTTVPVITSRHCYCHYRYPGCDRPAPP